MSRQMAALIFQLLGLAAGGAFLWTLWRQASFRKWFEADAEILESRVEKDADQNAYPYIRYRYEVGGRQYTNDKLYPHGTVASAGNHAAIKVAVYPAGSRTTIRYNPTDPEDSAIEARLPGWVMGMLMAACLCFFLLGLVISS